MQLRSRNVAKKKTITQKDQLRSDGSTIELKEYSFTTLFLPILLFRIINAMIVKTYFDPDEYWQSLVKGIKIQRPQNPIRK